MRSAAPGLAGRDAYLAPARPPWPHASSLRGPGSPPQGAALAFPVGSRPSGFPGPPGRAGRTRSAEEGIRSLGCNSRHRLRHRRLDCSSVRGSFLHNAHCFCVAGVSARHPVRREPSESEQKRPCGCNSGLPGRVPYTAPPSANPCPGAERAREVLPEAREATHVFQKHAKGTPRLVQRACVLCRSGEETDIETGCKQLYNSPKNWALRFDASVAARCPGT